jgi:hypothetical protein
MIIDDLADYIVSEGIEIDGVDLALGTNFFKGYLPDDEDDCVAIFDTGGLEPDMELPTGDPTFQILVRSSSYETAHTTIQAIADLLHQKRNETIGSTYYYFIYLMGEPGHIGRDTKNRDEFSANFHCRIRR